MKTHPTIYVVGAGAIGKSLSVFLKIAGRQVILLRGSVDDGTIQTEHIKVETATGAVHQADIDVATLSNFDTLNGIIVLANKSYGNAHLAKALKSKVGASPIVLLQNGLGIEKVFMTNDFQGVYRCVLFVTSQSLDQTTTRFKPVATCPIGIEKGNAATLETIVQELSTPDFGFKSEENIQPVIWKKAIVNSVFNSVCPLLEIDNGIFHRNKEALAIARGIISECIVIAGEKGVTISAGEVEESLLNISRSSDGQLISTYQDILHKRKTEIDTLNFEIARIAETLHKSDAVRNTKLLGELVKLKSDIHMRMS